MAHLPNQTPLAIMPTSQPQPEEPLAEVSRADVLPSNSSAVADAEPGVRSHPTLAPASPPSTEADWQLVQRHSQLVMAVVSVTNLTVRFANDHFCRLMGIVTPAEGSGTRLLDQLDPAAQTGLRRLFRRHILNAILHHRYGQATLVESRLLDEPLIVSLPQPQGHLRQIELRLRGNQIVIDHLNADLATALDACWQGIPDKQQVMAQLLTADSPLAQVLGQLTPKAYRASGVVLLEGADVTDRETAKTLMQLLVNRESLLQPQKLAAVNGLMQQLFGADGSFVLSAENDEAKLFTDLERPEWTIFTYAVPALKHSLFFQAIEQGQVVNVPDLQLNCPTDCERALLERGVRSLLIIPLVIKPTALGNSDRRLFGLVGVTSTQPYAFNQADCGHATTLIPALAAAMRHSVQDRFTSIHPSVRWRFEQEAERRNWGLPPEAIVFEDVYPLYGISDIRGSSEQRNRAIQTDLLNQFQLALHILEAACEDCPSALVAQLHQDLQDQVNTLQQGVTVDAEVTLLRYLKEELEQHFGYFEQCGPRTQAAIAAYQAALHPHHGCVYAARAVYDQTISQINILLRDTWNRWQQKLQGITRHYCDVEATDGIDHMIYAGKSIDPQFTDFHLRSLRYEQLRAMCDCARAAFTLKTCCDIDLEVTHLVLVQASTVDITHDENTERLFDVRGTRDTRYEIVKKRIDKACDAQTRDRITQPGKLTLVYSTEEEWREYQQYIRYLQREGMLDHSLETGLVEPLQGVSGLKFAQVRVLPAANGEALG